ncbi:MULTISPECIES: hypothetical protein [unclassified Crossiella]|uniref:hypothetical protein n=1 Tax=unclassified Crossiella TaxID=2620835 RepID=UPI001FFEF389|nr:MULTISPECIES: hypothetical protein [unclassified Crossiella]MCK2237824.1 hypothetical protein [Crossiella sp. S99.2]MCK2255110.1 hypothetical protein [Crossiella sp. S99.1]
MSLEVWVRPDESTVVTLGTLAQGQPVLSIVDGGCAVRIAVSEDVHGSAMGVRVARDLVTVAREFLDAVETFAFHSAQAYRDRLAVHGVVAGEVVSGASKHAIRDGE